MPYVHGQLYQPLFRLLDDLLNSAAGVNKSADAAIHGPHHRHAILDGPEDVRGKMLVQFRAGMPPRAALGDKPPVIG